MELRLGQFCQRDKMPDTLCAKAGYCLKRASLAKKPETKRRFIQAARRYWAQAVAKADRDAETPNGLNQLAIARQTRPT
jgi:hypothetical protein